MQDNDFNWFLENYAKLYEQYGQSFLAVKDETVLGSYATFKEAVETTLLTEKIGTFIIQECNGDESAYTACIASMNFM